jgi:site-specific recombinase XerD
MKMDDSNPRFLLFSEDDIADFLEKNENKNTLRKTRQDIALLKTFLSQKSDKEPEKFTRKNWIVIQNSSFLV